MSFHCLPVGSCKAKLETSLAGCSSSPESRSSTRCRHLRRPSQHRPLSHISLTQLPTMNSQDCKSNGSPGNGSKLTPDRSTKRRLKRQPIAVIGIGCRLPGADGPEAFWQLLRGGINAVTDVPQDRFDIAAFHDPRPCTPGKIASRSGGFIEKADRCDAPFFGISPREATCMDPQQRLLLEVA